MSVAEAVTRGVRVRVHVEYKADRSDPGQKRWFFAYRVNIRNEGAQTVQLLNRHWIITDAEGKSEEVRGPGVVGERPVIESGQAYEYTSFCPLPTPFGSMRGSYEMVTGDGETFDAEIPPFVLAEPFAVN